jgi:hypothetical protein
MLNKIYSRIKQSLADLLLVYAAMPATYQLKKRMTEDNLLSGNCEPGVTKKRYADYNIIVSLTTHRPRLHFVHLAIASIMRQTMKANRIILWLDYSLKETQLPNFIDLLVARGLEIRWCEDIKSYKKLIPTLKEFPNDAIITIDDDIIYEPDTLERLITAHLRTPNVVFGNRCAKIVRDAHGIRKSYKRWDATTQSTEISDDIFPIGVEGVIYPPKIFTEEVFNTDIYKNLCPTADDIWFKFMYKIAGVKSGLSSPRNLQTRLITEIPEATSTSLFNTNQTANDTQITLLEKHYGMRL